MEAFPFEEVFGWHPAGSMAVSNVVRTYRREFQRGDFNVALPPAGRAVLQRPRRRGP